MVVMSWAFAASGLGQLVVIDVTMDSAQKIQKSRKSKCLAIISCPQAYLGCAAE